MNSAEQFMSEHVTEGSPQWHKDADHDNCESCKSAFSFLKRRHHCRKCGNVVCDGCSKHVLSFGVSMTEPVHRTHAKPERACNGCHAAAQNLLASTLEPLTKTDEKIAYLKGEIAKLEAEREVMAAANKSFSHFAGGHEFSGTIAGKPVYACKECDGWKCESCGTKNNPGIKIPMSCMKCFKTADITLNARQEKILAAMKD